MATASLAELLVLAFRSTFQHRTQRPWLEVYSGKFDFAKCHMSTLTGNFLCLDHTFRTAKYVRNTDGSRAWQSSVSTIEMVETVTYMFTSTTSMVEAKSLLMMLQKRYHN